jgi:hypothetical protein
MISSIAEVISAALWIVPLLTRLLSPASDYPLFKLHAQSQPLGSSSRSVTPAAMTSFARSVQRIPGGGRAKMKASGLSAAANLQSGRSQT